MEDFRCSFNQSSTKAAGAVTNVNTQEAKAPEKSHIINNVETTDVKKVVGNDQVNISAGQEEQAQATVAACAADKNVVTETVVSKQRERLRPNYSEEELARHLAVGTNRLSRLLLILVTSR